MSGAFDRESSAGDVPQRARLRLRGTKRQASPVRPRTAAAILSMVDLLSCAFGGGLFLFMLTAAPSAPAPAAPEAMSALAVLKIVITGTVARPMILLRHVESGRSFVVDEDRLEGHSSRRTVAGAQSNTQGGKVWAVGATPWDVPDGTPTRTLLMLLENPEVGDWCVTIGLVDDDSHARSFAGQEVQIEKIEVWSQQAGSFGLRRAQSDFEAINAGPQNDPASPRRLLSGCTTVTLANGSE